jgi:hypothetical protein
MPAELEQGSATVVPDEAPPRKKKKGGAARERNELLDTLAVLSGGQLELVTRAMWGEAAKALSDIRAVCPDVSPQMIRSAAEAYRREWPKVSLSPSALAKNWGKFAPGAKKEGGAAEAMFAPGAVMARSAPEGWQSAMVDLFGDDWSDHYPAFETMLPADQRQVREWLSKHGKGGAK